MKKILLTISLFSTILIVKGQSPVGVWKVFNSEGDKLMYKVEIFSSNDTLSGKVVELISLPADSKCEKCSDDNKGVPIMDMIVITKLVKHNNFWRNGAFIDIEDGTEYSNCAIWFEDNNYNELIIRAKHWSGLDKKFKWIRDK